MIEGVGLAELQNECVLAHPIKKNRSRKNIENINPVVKESKENLTKYSEAI